MYFNINNMSSFALWKSVLRLVIVRIIDALHNNLKEVDIVGQRTLQEFEYPVRIIHAFPHGVKIAALKERLSEFSFKESKMVHKVGFEPTCP